MVQQNSTNKPSKSKSNTSNTSKNSDKVTTMAELLASTGYRIPALRRGQEVSGKIISISPFEILIDIGAKSEGLVYGRELAAVGDLIEQFSVGDKVDAQVIFPENDAGQVVLSLRKLSGEKRWLELEEKREEQEDIGVVAVEVNRGGVICDFLGLRGFLPASLLSVSLSGQAQAPAKLEQLIGKNLTVRVIEVDRSTNRLIFSQKQLSKSDIDSLLKLLSKVEIGEKYSGQVSAVLPFGIFVEIEIGSVGKLAGGQVGKKPTNPQTHEPTSQKLEGLVHISEISWEKVDDPSKLFKVGDKLEVMVIAKDLASGRLNLSVKQLATDPFLAVSEKYAKDQEVSGKVAKITPYGVFVTLKHPSTGQGLNEIEGLIHISKLPPNVSYEIGQVVECLVESVDTRARRISLVPVVREKPILYR
ncbi:hypothetical protein A2697_00615 [Candidatus Curtissbacteria bacterium RIFCSPHIGHO2_01_FULL_41_44]|uniref:S1 motif domain-containing protein n=1 Tax=Candidatus Curtissbacteria bacterium RIFCSPLOWO2_01_FULL_42_50 TaxID=1797730 RepID=A0A1F5H847_9BACT|nr:MAG: hypothetical protein A2697_00615 [Candidatus Curtissbacteria bacterium RIFCSPHIGHO2_01_FULL_41_44]OGE00258.1 MAG: hypothetical protein A3B54_00755 [Candidatus Curtissbacteria bacterium RIFCSPLOWO2_01_FULL_42_50]OGE03055.1 MAG: hypothetical protein A3G16_04145 [Candidatus Curtissbacteria bacterium RIFCSPLOWO2_12_FULL_41_16]